MSRNHQLSVVGHGVGLDIHEAPYVGRSAQRLRQNNVITIEPGLYYPDLGGIRIEDTVLITEDGAEILSALVPKEVDEILELVGRRNRGNDQGRDRERPR